MLELIAIAAGLVICFYLPYEANKVRNGWVRKGFKGTPAEFPTTYAKALKSFIVIGLMLGGVSAVVALLPQESGEWVFELLGAAVWFGVAGVAVYQRNRFARQPA